MIPGPRQPSRYGNKKKPLLHTVPLSPVLLGSNRRICTEVELKFLSVSVSGNLALMILQLLCLIYHLKKMFSFCGICV